MPHRGAPTVAPWRLQGLSYVICEWKAALTGRICLPATANHYQKAIGIYVAVYIRPSLLHSLLFSTSKLMHWSCMQGHACNIMASPTYKKTRLRNMIFATRSLLVMTYVAQVCGSKWKQTDIVSQGERHEPLTASMTVRNRNHEHLDALMLGNAMIKSACELVAI